MGHAGMYFVALVVLLKPFDVVVVVTPGGISKLHMIEAVALAYGGQVKFADYLSLIARSGQFAS